MLVEHVLIALEAAGAGHDGLGVDNDGVAVGIGALDAHYLAALQDQVLAGSLIEEHAALGLHGLGEGVHPLRAPDGEGMTGLIAHAVGVLVYIAEGDAQGHHLVDGHTGPAPDVPQQLGVHGGVGEVIKVIEDLLVGGGDPLLLGYYGLGPGRAAAAGEVGGGGVSGLLQHDDLGACFAGGMGGQQPGAAGAYDGDIGGVLHGLSTGLFHLVLKGGGIAPSLLDAGLNGGEDGVGGHGGASHGVHRHSLVVHHGLGGPLNGGLADAGSLIVADYLDGRDGSGGHGDFHLHIPVLAGAHAGVAAVSQFGGRGGGGGEVGDVHQLGGVGVVFVPRHLNVQQLAEVPQGSVGGAVIGKHLSRRPVRLGGGDGVAVDAHAHGGDSDAFLCPRRQSGGTHDHNDGQCEGGDPFLHVGALLCFVLEFLP